MLRTLVDHVIFSPERIIFEAQPILYNGLIKKNKDAYMIDGSIYYLDLSSCKSLTGDEEQKFQMFVNKAKEDNDKSQYMIESKIIFKEHFKKCIKDNSFVVRKEFKLLSSDEIAEKEYFLSQKRIFIPEHKIFIESGEEITVKDILDNPNKYHEQCCKDPHEPDYVTSTIAKIYSDQEKPVIFSFAHGGLTYHLQPEGLDEIPNF